MGQKARKEGCTMAPTLALLSLMFLFWIIAFASSFTEESEEGEFSSKGQVSQNEKAA